MFFQLKGKISKKKILKQIFTCEIVALCEEHTEFILKCWMKVPNKNHFSSIFYSTKAIYRALLVY